MGLENSKRWHWVVVSLAVGPMLAFMNSQAEPGAGLRSMAGTEFEREITLKEVPGEQPNIKNVVVHPPQVGAYEKPVHVVTMDRAVYDRTDKGWRYQKYALQAEVPYVTFGGQGRRPGPQQAPAVSPDRTILTVLSEMKGANPTIKYKYAWWEEPVWRYSLWTGSSLAVIGGIWPTVILLLIGAGLAPQPKEPKYDLERFGKGETPGSAPMPEKREMTEEERSQLASQIDKLEENIGTAAVMTDVPAPTGAAAGGEIRKLTGGPVEIAAVEKEEEDKEYKGEFYPVARPVHHDEAARH